MKYIKLGLTLVLSLSLLTGCSSEGDNLELSSVDGLISFDPNINYQGSHEIPIQQSGAIEFNKLDGVLQSDEFIAHNVKTGENIYLDWGYKYAGIIGDETGEYQRDYTSDIILVGLGFKDNWLVGEYELWLIRGNTYQALDRFTFCILKDVDVDLSQKQGGVITVEANGWLDISIYGSVDSLIFIQKSTGNIVEKVASTYKASDNLEYTPIKFSYEKYESGEYELWINRWGYDFNQKLCDFDIFQYSFVNSNPIVKETNGEYFIQFHVDKFNENDTYEIVDVPDQQYYYANGALNATNWDPETKIYKLKIEEDGWFGTKTDGIKFDVLLNINGFNISVTGVNRLQLSE